VEHRIKLLTGIVRLLMTMIPQQRGEKLREEGAEYQMTTILFDEDLVGDGALTNLLTHIPLPGSESNM
jgi:hypothetical protein